MMGRRARGRPLGRSILAPGVALRCATDITAQKLLHTLCDVRLHRFTVTPDGCSGGLIDECPKVAELGDCPQTNRDLELCGYECDLSDDANCANNELDGSCVANTIGSERCPSRQGGYHRGREQRRRQDDCQQVGDLSEELEVPLWTRRSVKVGATIRRQTNQKTTDAEVAEHQGQAHQPGCSRELMLTAQPCIVGHRCE